MGRLHPALGILICVGICFLAPLLGARSTPGTWYAELARPSFAPPGWVFGPVWTVLYIMMGVALWLVWSRGRLSEVALPLTLFGLQLVLNALWPVVFFGLHRPGLAFAEIVCLWVAIAATVAVFWRHRPIAGALLLPYLAWVTFAAVLNLAFWRLNA